MRRGVMPRGGMEPTGTRSDGSYWVGSSTALACDMGVSWVRLRIADLMPAPRGWGKGFVRASSDQVSSIAKRGRTADESRSRARPACRSDLATCVVHLRRERSRTPLDHADVLRPQLAGCVQ